MITLITGGISVSSGLIIPLGGTVILIPFLSGLQTAMSVVLYDYADGPLAPDIVAEVAPVS